MLHESINFFYVNIALDHLHLTFLPAAASPPVSEAVFNFVSAWSMMFYPLILTDDK